MDTAGAYDVMQVLDKTEADPLVAMVEIEAHIITNADTGALLTWSGMPFSLGAAEFGETAGAQRIAAAGAAQEGEDSGLELGMAITEGTSVTVVDGPRVPGQVGAVAPQVVTQDGLFVGTVQAGDWENMTTVMVAFDATGATYWSVEGEEPGAATQDGGVISKSGTLYRASGLSAGLTGTLPVYSWKQAYSRASIEAFLPVFDPAFLATSYAAVPKGNLTGNGFALVHHSFGLVFCGPSPGDGPCVSESPAKFVYLPVAELNSQSYQAAVEFSGAYPEWATAIKEQAYNQYRSAFANLPAIIAVREHADPMYGSYYGASATVLKFEHTNYITGYWPGDGLNAGNGDTPSLGNCNDKGICGRSYVYYLPIMGKAQLALAYFRGGTTPIIPAYAPPPLNGVTAAQFLDVMNAIGFAIGAIAVHETGHQLALSNMDCSGSGCEQLYENGSSDANHEWFYGTSPAFHIHWSRDARCRIEKILMGNSYWSFDRDCPDEN